VNADGDTHEHVLWTFGDLAVQFEKVGLFQCLEAKVVQLKVSIVNDGGVECVLVLHDNVIRLFRDECGGFLCLGMGVVVECFNVFGEGLGGHFMQIGYRDTRRKEGVIGVLCTEGSCGLSRKLVEFDGGHAGVNALDHLLRDDYWIDIFGI